MAIVTIDVDLSTEIPGFLFLEPTKGVKYISVCMYVVATEWTQS